MTTRLALVGGNDQIMPHAWQQDHARAKAMGLVGARCVAENVTHAHVRSRIPKILDLKELF